MNKFFQDKLILESTKEFLDFKNAEAFYRDTYATELAELEELEKEIRENLKETIETPYGKFGYTPAKMKEVWDEEALNNFSIINPDVLNCKTEKEVKSVVRLTFPRS